MIRETILMAGIVLCALAQGDAGSGAREGSHPFPMGRVLFTDAFATPRAVDVEIVSIEADRNRGLMYRRFLPEGKGMLFLYGKKRILSFWMRNTLIPLDILFFDENWKFLGLSENAEPLTDSPRVLPVPSKYVLEVPGGWTAKSGLRVGTRVTVEGLAGVSVIDP